MNKIDTKKLGGHVTEYKDGIPWTIIVDPMVAAKEIAEKVNEIVEWINSKKDQLL